MKALATGQHMIETRRKQENVYREYDHLAQIDRRISQVANFEITTNQKIDRRQRQVGYL